MVALFSTLLSNNEGDASTISSSFIPTVIQLYTSTLLNPSSSNSNTKLLPGHAILSYQAIQVPEEEDSIATQTTTEEASTLFGKRQANSGSNETPNLGVWNCRVSPLMDSLLHIPSPSSHYVFTVDLSDPTTVEPDITSMQQALVRHLIATSDGSTTTTTKQPTTTNTTTLHALSNVTFGLAPEDTPATTSVVALEESQYHVPVHVLICAIVPFHKKEYEETQAQNLVVYHLHRFAAAIGATLVFCQTTNTQLNNTTTAADGGEEQEEDNTLATLNVHQVARVWKRFAKDNPQTQHAAICDSNQHEELIETVFLRNANHPPTWNSSTDSLWKALPAKQEKDKMLHAKSPKPSGASSGDDEWLQQLRDSIASLATEPTTAATTTTTTSTSKAKQTDDAEVSSFFENLLKK